MRDKAPGRCARHLILRSTSRNSSTGAPAREHCDVTLSDGTVVGEITSGGFSPNLKKNISMGYVLKEHAKKGTELKVVVRKKVNDAVVTPMPFVPAKYHRPA